MSEEKSLTKSDLVDVLGTFTEDVLLPKMQEMIDTNFVEKIKPEIMKAKQEMMDYTDKRIGQSEGKILPKINAITDVLRNKNVINDKDAVSIRSAGSEI